MSSSAAPLRVIAFPGAPNLPTFAAVEQGFFADQSLEIDLELTPSSVYQAERAAAGACDIVCTAFDNVVAYSEGQGAAGAALDPGYVVIAGATQLEIGFVVAPEVSGYPDLAGKTIALDALTTGFAFVLYEMLDRAGVSRADVSLAPVGATPQRWRSVKDGEHAGTLTIEPFTSLARSAGFTLLDSSSRLFDSFQGGVIATTRAFAAAQPEKVAAFLRGYLRGLAWTLNPANRQAAADLLRQRMPEIPAPALAAVIESLMSPKSGLTPGAAVLPEGMRTVLGLRSKFGTGQGRLTDPGRYLDLSHLRAIKDAD